MSKMNDLSADLQGIMDMSLYERLLNIQNELKVPKSQKNTFGGYNYRSAEDILENAKPVLAKYCTVLTVSDRIILIGERYYIEATATLHDVYSDAQIENVALAREEETKKGMDGSQITGTASSYARKYALNGLFALDDTKDADTDEHTKTTKNEPMATDKQVAMVKELLSQDRIDKMLAYYKIDSVEGLTVKQASDIIKKESK